MKKAITQILLSCTCVAGAWLGCSAAWAFPTKPIRVVMGFPAGGPLDQHARILSDRLQTQLGQPIIIDYKSGAGGTVGAQEVMKAPADGHTILLANTGVMVINPSSSSTPRPAPGRSITARLAMAAAATWCPRCSSRPQACSWCTSLTGAVRQPSPT